MTHHTGSLGTTRVRLICTLYPKRLTKIRRNASLDAPALSGLTARPRAATPSHSKAVTDGAGGLRSSLSAAVLGCRHGVGRLRRTLARPISQWGTLGG